MRKMEAILLMLFLAFEMWAGGVPGVSAASVRSATINLVVGETYEYNHFNLTLVDINPVTSTILVNVSGIQGTELATVEKDFVDVFGDGTIQIRTVAVYISNKQATVEVKVDVEALANVACSELSSLIAQAEANGTLPEVVLNQSKQSLELAEQYRDYGWYDDAINTAWKALNELRENIAIATEAKKAIIDAKNAITDPSSCVPGCQECPLSITLKARNMVSQAEEYYNQGYFEDALQTATNALQLIKDCCNACKVFLPKKKDLENYLDQQTKEIPSNLFKAVRNKIETAQKYYDNGDCVDAISYLDDARELAETIVQNWRKAMSCRTSLLANITASRKVYYTIFNNTVIRIYVDDIEKSANKDLYNLIKAGYFESALSKCSKLSDELNARERQFNETKGVLASVWNHIIEVQSRGYVIGPAVEKFKEALVLMEKGNYEDARAKFLEANETVDYIVSMAKEAQKSKNQTLACLTNLSAEGIDVQSVFGDDMKLADELYKEGKYEEAKSKWDSIRIKCTDPLLKEVIEQKEKTHEKYAEVKARGLVIPEDVNRLLSEADEDFKSGNFQEANAKYKEAMSSLNEIEQLFETWKNEESKTKEFYAQSSKWGENVAKWFGIPLVEERVDSLGDLIKKAQKELEEGNYSAFKSSMMKINDIMTDVDGDGSKNWNDPLPYVPNYYLVGLLFAVLLMFFNIVR